MSTKMRFPARQFPRFDCKAHMDRPGSIVWWNCSAWKLGGFLGCAADKKQQHVPRATSSAQKRSSSTKASNPITCL